MMFDVCKPWLNTKLNHSNFSLRSLSLFLFGFHTNVCRFTRFGVWYKNKLAKKNQAFFGHFLTTWSPGQKPVALIKHWWTLHATNSSRYPHMCATPFAWCAAKILDRKYLSNAEVAVLLAERKKEIEKAGAHIQVPEWVCVWVSEWVSE